MNAITEITVEPDLASYNIIVVAFSGGKDSLACLLHLLDSGVPPSRIELHHHDVDGGAGHFMDWPITAGYCRAVARHFGIPIYFSRKQGGFEREMLRSDSLTAPMEWEGADGKWHQTGGVRGKPSTRLQFPQVHTDLSVRWCSAYLKIDVLAALIRNEPRFMDKRTLVVTGERAQESTARAKYKTFEPDRADNRNGLRNVRLVDHFRPIHQWKEAEVWGVIERSGIVPHPAYRLGWSRLSCRTCIFGSPNQWATIRALYPDTFSRIARYEQRFGKTIQRKLSVEGQADKGTPYASAVSQPELAAFANQDVWTGPIVTNAWKLPAGAFGENAGPC